MVKDVFECAGGRVHKGGQAGTETRGSRRCDLNHRHAKLQVRFFAPLGEPGAEDAHASHAGVGLFRVLAQSHAVFALTKFLRVDVNEQSAGLYIDRASEAAGRGGFNFAGDLVGVRQRLCRLGNGQLCLWRQGEFQFLGQVFDLFVSLQAFFDGGACVIDGFAKRFLGLLSHEHVFDLVFHSGEFLLLWLFDFGDGEDVITFAALDRITDGAAVAGVVEDGFNEFGFALDGFRRSVAGEEGYRLYSLF